MIDRNGNRAFGLSRTAETAISKKSGKTYRVMGGGATPRPARSELTVCGNTRLTPKETVKQAPIVFISGDWCCWHLDSRSDNRVQSWN